MTTNMNSTRARSPPSPPVSPPRRNPHATRPMPPLPPNKNHRDRKPLPATHTHPQPKPKLACTKSYGSATSVISCASTSSTSTSTSISSTNLIMNSPVSPTKPLPHVRRLAISALAETQSMPVSVNRTHHFRQPPLTHAASQKLMKTKSHDVTLPPSPPQRKQVHATPIDAHYNPHKHLRKHFTENNILLHSVPSKSKNIPRTSPQSPKNPKSPKTLHTPRTPKSPQSPNGRHHHLHHHHRSASNSSNTSASHFSFQRRSSSESSLLVTKAAAAAADPDGMRRDIDCICGRKMQYTQNPQRKYPPKALLYCQQNNRCRKQMMIGGDWFYSCKAKTSYHETKDGHFRICYSCSISQSAKQVRIRRNHQLLIKQMKNEHHGKVLITQNTKDYILSSTSSKSKDETLRLLKQTYIEDDVGDDVGGGDGDGDDDKRCETPSQQHNRRSLTMGANQDASKWVLLNGQQQRILKSGWMMKTGNFWNKSFKKRYFQLLHNKCLLYYKQFEHGQASEQRGMADLSIVHRITPKGNKGFEVCTPSRDWKFLCVSMLERDEWLSALRQFLNVSQAPLNVHHRKQYSDTMESHSQSCSHISQTHSAMNPMFATQCLHE